MVIYVEYVIIDNFALDFFIALIVCKYYSIKGYKGVISALLGTILALVYPIIPKTFTIIFKIGTLLSTVYPLTIKASIRHRFSILFVYTIVSSLFSGIISLLVGSTESYYSNGGKVFIICTIAILIFVFGRKLLVKLMLKKKSDYVNVEINHRVYKGFFDNGNKVTASDGCGVIFLDKKVAKLFYDIKPSDYVLTQTVNGGEIKEVIIIPSIKIYFEGKQHTYNNVNAIKTDKYFHGFDILLSHNLKEN